MDKYCTSKKSCDQLIHENEKLIQALSQLIDYAGCMAMATGYKSPNTPNLLSITRLLNEVKQGG